MCINLPKRQIDYFHFYSYIRNGSSFIAPGQSCPFQHFCIFLLLLLEYKISRHKMHEKTSNEHGDIFWPVKYVLRHWSAKEDDTQGSHLPKRAPCTNIYRTVVKMCSLD